MHVYAQGVIVHCGVCNLNKRMPFSNLLNRRGHEDSAFGGNMHQVSEHNQSCNQQRLLMN